MSSQKKNTAKEKIPDLKHNKMLSTWDRAKIMKIIPSWPRVSLPRFSQSNPIKPFGEILVDSL